jgi:hypothetical protein
MLELQDEIKASSQAKVQDEINLHNEQKRAINAS